MIAPLIQEEDHHLMDKFEYLSITQEADTDPEFGLNQAAEQGWELVGIQPFEKNTGVFKQPKVRYILKRKKNYQKV